LENVLDGIRGEDQHKGLTVIKTLLSFLKFLLTSGRGYLIPLFVVMLLMGGFLLIGGGSGGVLSPFLYTLF